MARETGLEPAASAVTGRRSNQLSYSRSFEMQTDINFRRSLSTAFLAIMPLNFRPQG